MVHFQTIVVVRLVLATHIFVHIKGIESRVAVDLAANPVVDTSSTRITPSADWLWLCVDAGSCGTYRFGYDTSSLCPSNLKCIQRMNPVTSKWEPYWF